MAVDKLEALKRGVGRESTSPNKPLGNFIDKFNKETVLVNDTNDRKKRYLLWQGFHKGKTYVGNIEIGEPMDLNDLLRWEKNFILNRDMLETNKFIYES